MSNKISSKNGWNYFESDPEYSRVLQKRLMDSVHMDSASALAYYLELLCSGDLRIADFGGGPGHYYPVITKFYSRGKVQYKSIDIDESSINFGKNYFAANSSVKFVTGSILNPELAIDDENCLISANIVPHVPDIKPLLHLLNINQNIKYFVIRMLIGGECVQIKKHLSSHKFEDIYESGYQLNNIYSMDYIRHYLNNRWKISQMPDIFHADRLKIHSIPGHENDSFYANRVSTYKSGLVFKGEIFMPWFFLLGERS